MTLRNVKILTSYSSKIREILNPACAVSFHTHSLFPGYPGLNGVARTPSSPIQSPPQWPNVENMQFSNSYNNSAQLGDELIGTRVDENRGVPAGQITHGLRGDGADGTLLGGLVVLESIAVRVRQTDLAANQSRASL